MTLKTQDDCEQICNGISLCNSFTYEPNVKSCWLKEKEVIENEDVIDRDDYFTVYRSCEQGIKTFRIIIHFLVYKIVYFLYLFSIYHFDNFYKENSVTSTISTTTTSTQHRGKYFVDRCKF